MAHLSSVAEDSPELASVAEDSPGLANLSSVAEDSTEDPEDTVGDLSRPSYVTRAKSRANLRSSRANLRNSRVSKVSFRNVAEDSSGNPVHSTPAHLSRVSRVSFRPMAGDSSENSGDAAGYHSRPSYDTKVSFRNISGNAAAGGSSFVVKNRSVKFNYDVDREVEWHTPTSQAGQVSTLPMALDNDRFFSPEHGYGALLAQVASKMEKDETDGSLWKEANSNVMYLGWLWRFFLRMYLQVISDAVNRLRFTRGLEVLLPFLTGYESLALGGVIRAFDLDSRGLDGRMLALAFKNRNVSRILMRNLPRYDLVWHLSTQVVWNRVFDFLSVFPFIGLSSFGATENFNGTKNHALRAIFKHIWAGSWLTRFLTSNQQSLTTLDARTPAQNLAAEGTGFEVANRSQLGTYFGRRATNKFRIDNRLPTDEGIVRTFMTSPASTMVNNGVEHVLRCLAKHWRNMLYQENGNFAHQRMEQLNPFEVLRFHMPIVLVTLSNLRGRNKWDSVVLGPMIKKLQNLGPEKVQSSGGGDSEEDGDSFEGLGACETAQKLIEEMEEHIASSVCGGIPSRIQPFKEWLEAIHDACGEWNSEAEEVQDFVSSVDIGIKLGYSLMKTVNWHVPSEMAMISAISAHLRKESPVGVPADCIRAALDKLAPKDKTTLECLHADGMGDECMMQLLLGRTTSLLERELRRGALDDRIRELSKGEKVLPGSLVKGNWYWVNREGSWRVFVFNGWVPDRTSLKLVDVDANVEMVHEVASVGLMTYVPVAEAISRAQKVFMIMELDHGKKFAYNAFMENNHSLRTRLRHLMIVSQLHCSELDKARLNVLVEVKNSASKQARGKAHRASMRHPSCRPQSVIILGGGPTGMLTAIHCVQNVVSSGGEVKLYEERDGKPTRVRVHNSIW
jgi:hypothetical protein